MAANGGGGGVLAVSIRRSAETITIPNIERAHNARMLLRKQNRNQEIKGYERPVRNDWDIIQLARFPDESRKRTHIPDDGWRALRGICTVKGHGRLFSGRRSVLISSPASLRYH